MSAARNPCRQAQLSMSVKKFAENLGRTLRELVDKEMSSRQRRLGHIRAALAPLGRNVKQPRHLACRTIQHERWTGDAAVDIGNIVLEIDARGGAIVGAGPMTQSGIAPRPTTCRD